MQKKRLVYLLLLLGVFLFGWWAREFFLIDSCLDRGGRWNGDAIACEGTR